MDRINRSEINNIQFRAVKSENAVGKEVVKMEELIKKAVANLLEKAKSDAVPPYGSFGKVSEKFKNTDKSLVVDEFILEIFQPPKGVKNQEIRRGLRLGASKPGRDPSMFVLIEDGTKDDIIAKLKDEKLIERLLKETKNLSYHLEDL